jgi:hypothetical protein
MSETNLSVSKDILQSILLDQPPLLSQQVESPQETVVSNHYRAQDPSLNTLTRIGKQSRFSNLQQFSPQRQPTLLQNINSLIASRVSSDRSILNMSIVKSSRFLRYSQGISLFIRENWQLIRVLLIGTGVLIAVLIVIPALIAL